ncbi:MAG: hypothetical protein IPK52_26055 [Chloroflexi bacterium]|nr:hypothetical protein [Chloroflexota bacterium]
MKLVIVETHAQAKALAASLGEGWRVEPCYGFVRDLPPNALGVEPDHDFRPTFNIAPGQRRQRCPFETSTARGGRDLCGDVSRQ